MGLTRRQKLILSTLGGGAYVEVKDLADRLGVDPSTIRRDLQSLSGEGLVERLHGGVRLHQSSQAARPDLESIAIAGAARRMLRGGETIALSTGPVTEKLIPLLFDLTGLTVYTHDLRAAEALNKHSSIIVQLAGGELREADGRSVTSGPATASFFSSLRLDWAFIEVEGIHPYGGFTTSRPWLVATQRVMLESARKRCVLAPTEAFGVRCVGFISPVKDVDLLITGEELPDHNLPVFGGRVVRAALDFDDAWRQG